MTSTEVTKFDSRISPVRKSLRLKRLVGKTPISDTPPRRIFFTSNRNHRAPKTKVTKTVRFADEQSAVVPRRVPRGCPVPRVSPTPVVNKLFKVGTKFDTRADLIKMGAHRTLGCVDVDANGVVSLVLTGDNHNDYNHVITITGLAVTKCKTAWEASLSNKRPIHVIRSSKLKSRYAPSKGFMYCGLFTVEEKMSEHEKDGIVFYRLEIVADKIIHHYFKNNQLPQSSQLAITHTAPVFTNHILEHSIRSQDPMRSIVRQNIATLDLLKRQMITHSATTHLPSSVGDNSHFAPRTINNVLDTTVPYPFRDSLNHFVETLPEEVRTLPFDKLCLFLTSNGHELYQGATRERLLKLSSALKSIVNSHEPSQVPVPQPLVYKVEFKSEVPCDFEIVEEEITSYF